MVNPIFTHVGIDNWFADLFWAVDCLYFCPNVIIEHMHANVGKAPMDEQYQWIYGDEMRHGMEVFNSWKQNNREADIRKFKQLLKGVTNGS